MAAALGPSSGAAAGDALRALLFQPQQRQQPPARLSWPSSSSLSMERVYAKPVLHRDGEFWLYPPAAIEKAPPESRRGSVTAKFRLWKKQGFLHCQALGADRPLVLPVFMSDGCGYPALSTVLRAWLESGSARWDVFLNYLAAAAEQGSRAHPSSQVSELMHTVDAERLSETSASFVSGGLNGKRLDTRYDTKGASKEWALVTILAGSE